MNSDAENIINEQTDSEYIILLVEVMKRISEQLDYLIEIME